MNSTNGRARGTRSRTQNAVGISRAMLTMIVTMPMRNEYPRLSQNPSLVRTLP